MGPLKVENVVSIVEERKRGFAFKGEAHLAL